MVDIKEIVCREKSFINEAEYYSNKYQIPVNSISSKNCYIDISFENSLVFKENRISNLFHKDPFFRRIKNYQREIMLKKAISYQIGKPKRVLDATAGLGRDGFIFALLGQNVTMVEENKGMCILIESALNRLPKTSYFNDAKNRIKIINADSSKLKLNTGNFDIIYLDPMFSTHSKSMSNKELTFLKTYIDQKQDFVNIFLKKRYKRLVVKREKSFKSQSTKRANIIYKGKSINFHVFM
tara:strand:+ start:637 stop:1353 length:717 start_codon:yes stop_codon:yes gene_type:complete